MNVLFKFLCRLKGLIMILPTTDGDSGGTVDINFYDNRGFGDSDFGDGAGNGYGNSAPLGAGIFTRGSRGNGFGDGPQGDGGGGGGEDADY